MSLKFTFDTKTLEEMLIYIGEKNKIKTFNLRIYTPEIDPDYSDNETDTDMQISLKELKNKKFSEIKRDPMQAVGICSKVELIYGRTAHLKQLDLDSVRPDSKYAVSDIKKVLKKVFPKDKNYEGFAIFSGRGFHYCGVEILNKRDWKESIKHSKTLPQIEDKWSDIQLSRGFSILRATSSHFVKPQTPKLLYHIKKE